MSPKSSAARDRESQVLQRVRSDLQGREVGIYESAPDGSLRLVIATSEGELPRPGELERELKDRHIGNQPGRRWVASRLGNGRWAVAPVRSTPPGPPPSGVERRGPERAALERAGVALGVLQRPEVSRAPTRSATEILRQHQARLGLIMEQVPAILWTTDESLRITSRSGSGTGGELLLPERVVGVSLIDQYQAQRVTAESLEAHARALSGDAVNYRIESANRCYDAHVKPLYAEDGSVVGTVGLAMDVTDRERALSEARRSQQELADFFENATVGIHFVSAEGVILRANQFELQMLGYAKDEYVGRNIVDFHLDPEVPAEVLRRVTAGEQVENLEARMRHKDGSVRYVMINSSGYFEHGKFVHTRSVTRDVTERKQSEEMLRHGAMHDPLTNLPNRAFFLERLEQAVERARRDPGYRFAVLFLDFDNFKIVNDSLGHSIGDQLLMNIAERLRNCVRPADMVARLGGDEFIVLLEEVGGVADVEHSTRRIQRCLAAPYELEGREVHSSASIGVALSGDGRDTPDDLVRDADIAMYRAKAQGRARFQMFDATMRVGAQERFGLEMDLRSAIERGEFRLLFQPIVELRTGRVHGFEALIRWHHGERGVIRPPEFIPIAEETGMIVPIGNWAMREALWNARRWQTSYRGQGPIRVSVNVSAKQMSSGARLIEDVKAALREENVDPSTLRLEITESALMDDVEGSIELLTELRNLGVELHMDDFGTGYSSLAYLPRFPIQTIKIDKSFTNRMGLRRTDQEIVRSIVDLARNLGVGVIAEGVENATQRTRLLEFGCQLAQGFYFAEPLEPAAAGALLGTSGISELGDTRGPVHPATPLAVRSSRTPA